MRHKKEGMQMSNIGPHLTQGHSCQGCDGPVTLCGMRAVAMQVLPLDVNIGLHQ